VREFVQDFYDWYVPKFWQRSPKLAVKVALKHRSYLFKAELAQALDDYSQLPGKGRRTIAGSLYDPFLNAGDACERYQVGAINAEGRRYQVSVYAICLGILRANPVVTAELTREGDHWEFVNFRYPDESDVLMHARGIPGENEAPPSK
jgi:hypothetical protein